MTKKDNYILFKLEDGLSTGSWEQVQLVYSQSLFEQGVALSFYAQQLLEAAHHYGTPILLPPEYSKGLVLRYVSKSLPLTLVEEKGKHPIAREQLCFVSDDKRFVEELNEKEYFALRAPTTFELQEDPSYAHRFSRSLDGELARYFSENLLDGLTGSLLSKPKPLKK